MVDSQTDDAAAEIVRSLTRRAIELWGRDRTEELLPVIEQTARQIWQVSKRLPPADEEPAFCL